jgi:phytoene synthase
MQLTNILRDIDEDLERGRIYLPAEEMERFGYTVADLQARTKNQGFLGLMTFQADRAQRFYNRGNSGISMLHPDGRFAVKIASNVYHEILTRLQDSSFDVFDHRTVVPARRKYWITARCLAGPFARQLFWRSS